MDGRDSGQDVMTKSVSEMSSTSKQVNFTSADALEDHQLLLNDQLGRPLDSQSDQSDGERRVGTKKRKKKKTKQLAPQLDSAHQEDSQAQWFEKQPQIRPSRPSNSYDVQLGPTKPAGVQDQPTSSAKQNQKRKRHRHRQPNQKQSQPKREAVQRLELQPASLSPNESTSIGVQPPDLQLNYLVDRQKRALPDLSDLELDSLRIKPSWLQDLTGRPLRAQIGSWLKTTPIPNLLEALNSKPDIHGSPVVLVVSSSALRVVDLCRELKPLVPTPNESGTVAKLFSRHFKLNQHILHLSSNPVSIGVGTPDRIVKLMNSDALKLGRLGWVILDVTWTDPKGYTLAELPGIEFRLSLWKELLGCPKLVEKFNKSETKLVLF